MKKTVWSPEAALDLRRIYHFYLPLSSGFAISIYRQVREEVKLIKRFPTMAPVEPLLEGCTNVYRSLTVRGMFKVIYYIDGDVINITNVWDCRQDPDILIERVSGK